MQADLVRRCLIAFITLEAPDSKRPSSRLNWLVRQLTKSDPTDVHIEAQIPGRAAPVRMTLAQARSEGGVADAVFGSSLPTAFRVMMVRDIAGRFGGNKTFIEELEKLVPEFYENVGQHLEAFRPKPPQVKAETQPQAHDAAEMPSLEERRAVALAADDAAAEALDVLVSGMGAEGDSAPLEPSPDSEVSPSAVDSPGEQGEGPEESRAPRASVLQADEPPHTKEEITAVGSGLL